MPSALFCLPSRSSSFLESSWFFVLLHKNAACSGMSTKSLSTEPLMTLRKFVEHPRMSKSKREGRPHPSACRAQFSPSRARALTPCWQACCVGYLWVGSHRQPGKSGLMLWTAPPPAPKCHGRRSEDWAMQAVTTIDLDIAKSVFQVHRQ
jgi:hypothetical protein